MDTTPNLLNDESLISLATMGKLTFTLLAIVVFIFVCAWLLKRLENTRVLGHSDFLKIITARTLGGRERIVVVEVDNKWLVLGVTSQQITKLYECPAQAPEDTPNSSFLSILMNKRSSTKDEE